MQSLQYGLEQQRSDDHAMPPKKKKMQNLMQYAGKTKEEIRQIKKEKKQRKLWNKYKEKLEKERQVVAAQFRNNYYWDCFAISSNHETRKANQNMQSTGKSFSKQK